MSQGCSLLCSGCRHRVAGGSSLRFLSRSNDKGQSRVDLVLSAGALRASKMLVTSAKGNEVECVKCGKVVGKMGRPKDVGSKQSLCFFQPGLVIVVAGKKEVKAKKKWKGKAHDDLKHLIDPFVLSSQISVLVEPSKASQGSAKTNDDDDDDDDDTEQGRGDDTMSGAAARANTKKPSQHNTTGKLAQVAATPTNHSHEAVNKKNTNLPDPTGVRGIKRPVGGGSMLPPPPKKAAK